MTITFNPQLVTNAFGGFNAQSSGWIVGEALDDPAYRYALRGGVLGPAETLPMWGGLAVSVAVPPAIPASDATSLGGIVTRAAAVAGHVGFSVFNQDHAMVSSPQSPVPLASNGMRVHYYLLGSRARIAVPISAALLGAAAGALYNQPCAWDYTNQQLIVGTGLPVEILAVAASGCMVPVYTPGTGFCTWNYNGAAAIIQL
jgi:hypothetical protein